MSTASLQDIACYLIIYHYIYNYFYFYHHQNLSIGSHGISGSSFQSLSEMCNENSFDKKTSQFLITAKLYSFLMLQLCCFGKIVLLVHSALLAHLLNLL